jgi:hypothetical protein
MPIIHRLFKRKYTPRHDPIEDSHADVHKHHVGLELAGEGDSLSPVGRLSKYLHVTGRVDHVPKPPADKRLVVVLSPPERGRGHGIRRTQRSGQHAGGRRRPDLDLDACGNDLRH